MIMKKGEKKIEKELSQGDTKGLQKSFCGYNVYRHFLGE